VYVAQNGRGYFESCEIEGGVAAAVEVGRDSQPIFVRVRAKAGRGPAVEAAAGSRPVFIDPTPDPSDSPLWRLLPGHQCNDSCCGTSSCMFTLSRAIRREFRRLERKWPDYAACNREMDALHEKFGVQYW
jgi:hypothetical protein